MSPAPAIKPEPRDPSDAEIVRPIPLTEVVSPGRRAQNEALLAFDAEEAKEQSLESSPPRARRTRLIVIWTLTVLAAVALAGVVSFRGWWPAGSALPPVAAPTTGPESGSTASSPTGSPLASNAEGTANISSRPEGAEVLVDGVLRGVTPLRLSLPIGNHTLELLNSGSRRVLPLAIEAGTVASHYVELAPGVGAQTGRLEVLSEPAGARVTVDGVPRGTTPLILATIAAGQHTVVVVQGESRVVRTVNVAAGASASVLASLAAEGVAAGWVSFTSPLELQVFEEGRLLGTTSTPQILLPAGRHVLELVSAPYDFRKSLTVQVQTGRTVASSVSIPTGSLSINALPWAEAFLDGKPLGTTPLANLPVTIGTHELVLRHPQLGERRQSVLVTTNAPARVGVDLRK